VIDKADKKYLDLFALDSAEFDFISRVLTERRRQDERWGGPTHDDEHAYVDWLRFIRQQLYSIMYVPGTRAELDDAVRDPKNLEAFCSRMVKIAALAMAATQSARRKAKQK
jgi:hypothetical protein